MIKRASEIPKATLTNFKDGVGDTNLSHFMTEAEAHGTGRLFAKISLEPGSSVGKHTHEGDFEIYYILKGKALIDDNGTEVELEPGDCNICADGEFHSIKNIGEETLEYIAIILFTKQKI